MANWEGIFLQYLLKDIRFINYEVKESKELLEFLLSTINHKGRNSIKSMLAREQIRVNGIVRTQYDFPLKVGQTVSVLKNNFAKSESELVGVKILFEDKDLIIVEKEANLLTVASNKERENTVYTQLINYAKKVDKRNKVFIVHRLDRETSGILIFAKSEKVQNRLQNDWHNLVKERKYIAIVEGDVTKEAGTITSYLVENEKTLKVFSTRNEKLGKKAITHYKKIDTNGNLTRLEVQLVTGRKNQIRVHMSELGHPVVGDKKYGAKINPMKRLGLHANKIVFVHPMTNELISFESKIPKSFKRLMKTTKK